MDGKKNCRKILRAALNHMRGQVGPRHSQVIFKIRQRYVLSNLWKATRNYDFGEHNSTLGWNVDMEVKKWEMLMTGIEKVSMKHV